MSSVRLAAAAREALGDHAASVEIETGTLLRRQIARRCIYGLDLNLIAVELARVSIWIHTFVPGLPMSALDHNLVVGNSLTGIGTIDEVLGVLEPQRVPRPGQFLRRRDQGRPTERACQHLYAQPDAEATKAEVREAARALRQGHGGRCRREGSYGRRRRVRLGLIPLPPGPGRRSETATATTGSEEITRLQVAHFPYLFPEVFSVQDRPAST